MTKDDKDKRTFDAVLEEFDMYFHDCFGSKLPVAFIQDIGWKPMTDVFETEQDLVMRIEVGGVSEEEIEATWEGETLLVRGVRGEQKHPGVKVYHKMEITTGPFERRITAPPHLHLQKDSLRMSYKNGIFEIKIRHAITDSIINKLRLAEISLSSICLPDCILSRIVAWISKSPPCTGQA